MTIETALVQLVIRCSSLDRVLACAGSLAETEAPFAPNNPEANEGRAAHEAMAAVVVGLTPDLDAIAARYGVSADVLAELVRKGRRVWEEVQQWFSGDHSADVQRLEAELAPGIMLRGTSDLTAAAPESISILDHKFGFAPSPHPHQLRGYAYLARARHGMPASGYILGVESWARIGEYRVHKFTDADLDRLRAEILEQVRLGAKQYGPGGDACRYCPHRNSCVAHADWLRSGVVALVPVEQNLPVTREMLAAAYERAKAWRVVLASFDAALDMALDEGPITLPDGRTLSWDESEQDEITPSKALDYLRDELKLEPHEIDQVITVTKGGLEDVMRERAPKRQGPKWFRAALARLRGLDAVTRIPKRRKKLA